ncbi:hypothetical protein [Comamonas thiooxydans]|uniref:hypothetical protein n=1 Tax=Comamonas thiooxydans TaxID=363952 RepID=UPI00050E784F|nr:hypothetical protein [Comamonas thiooxydans]KGG86711.1 hypothetical protein P609_11155 [Comamonas thiooxydans]
MNADQVIGGIGRAVAATKPAPEYCLFWIDHWSTCMTKSEWSGWMQAIGSIAAIVFALTLPYIQNKYRHARTYVLAKQGLIQLASICTGMSVQISLRASAKHALSSKKASIESLWMTLQLVRVEELPPEARPLWWTAQSNAKYLVELPEKLGSEAGFANALALYEQSSLACLEAFKDFEPRLFGIRASRIF